MVKLRHTEILDTRLYLDKIAHPDYVDENIIRLRRLVGEMDIVVGQDFVPNGTPPKLRAKYLRIAPAFNKMIVEQYNASAILIVPTSAAKKVSGVCE